MFVVVSIYSAWGLSGSDTKSQHQIIHGFIAEMGLAHFSLANDSDLGIYGGLF